MKLVASSCLPPQRLEILHVDTSGDAELWIVLYQPVPVSHDQVTPELFLWLAVFVIHIEIVQSVVTFPSLASVIVSIMYYLCTIDRYRFFKWIIFMWIFYWLCWNIKCITVVLFDPSNWTFCPVVFFNHFRWTKLRINMLPGTVLEPVSECFLASLIIGWAAHHVLRYTANHRAEAGSWHSCQTC